MQRLGHFFLSKMTLMACLSLFLLVGCSKDASKESQGRPMPAVSTMTLTPHKVILTTELSGRTSAFRVAEIRPRVSGLIERRLFAEGSNVTEGQLLYQIDPAPFQAELDNAEAALAAAGATLADVIGWTVLIHQDADLRAAYGAVGPKLARNGAPPLVTAARVAGLGVPGALIEVSAIAALAP